MFNRFDWRLLQLFSGEGGSGAASAGDGASAATGDNGADAGHENHREPAADIQKTLRPDWQEILKDPGCNAEIRKIVSARVKEAGQSKAILDILEPALRQLAQQHGMDPDRLDHRALARAITDRPRDANGHRRQFLAHMQSLQQQEQEMKARIPGFDLSREMRDPTFRRLTSPGVGLSVEQAFNAVHFQEMQQMSMQVAAQRTQEMISTAIQSGTHRPREAGGAQAPSVSRFSYKSATPAQRSALKAEIRRAAAEGRKVYPGGR